MRARRARRDEPAPVGNKAAKAKPRPAPGSRHNPIGLDDSDDDDDGNQVPTPAAARAIKPEAQPPRPTRVKLEAPPHKQQAARPPQISTPTQPASRTVAGPTPWDDGIHTQEGRRAKLREEKERLKQQAWDDIKRCDSLRTTMNRMEAARDMELRRAAQATEQLRIKKAALSLDQASMTEDDKRREEDLIRGLRDERSYHRDLATAYDNERQSLEAELVRIRDERYRREESYKEAIHRYKAERRDREAQRRATEEERRAQAAEQLAERRRKEEADKEARRHKEGERRYREAKLEADRREGAAARTLQQSRPNIQPAHHQLVKTEDPSARSEAECRRRMEEDEAARLERRREILQWMADREAAGLEEIEADHKAARTLERSGSSTMTQSKHRVVKDEDGRARKLDGVEPIPPEDIDHLMRMPEIDIPVQDRPVTPMEMSCKLLPHQQVALKWLKEQEKDKGKRGGLLADTMGLGKTIAALSLILSNKAPAGTPKTTLIVAPLALLRQWEREVHEKVKPEHMLSTFIYHGPAKKTRQARRLFDYNVVLTSYETVTTSDHLNIRRNNRRALLYQEKFYRIILDEAHRIKNRNAQYSVAVADLQAHKRLCMTGTPFMNNVVELYPLLRFLQIKPYNDLALFQANIGGPVRKWDKDPEEYAAGMRLLQAVFRSITLRRTKESQLDGKPIIVLPQKTILKWPVELDEEQRAYYVAMEQKQQIKVNKYLKRGMSSKIYTYILLLLLRLRQVCCHPWLIKDHGIPEEAQLSGKEMVSLALRLDKKIVEQLSRRTEFKCPLCDDIAETPMIIWPCGHDLCANCFSNLIQVSQGQRPGDPDMMLHSLQQEDAVCPHEDCEDEIDPKKVLCYSFFQVAYGLGDASGDLKDELEDQKFGDSDSGAEDEDEQTKSDEEFIVDDDEVEYEEESGGEDENGGESEGDESAEEESGDEVGSKSRTRPTQHKDLLDSEDESDADVKLPPIKHEGKASKAKGKKVKDEDEDEEKEDIWAYFRRRQSEGWKVKKDSDSDSSSLLSIKDLVESPGAKKTKTEGAIAPEAIADHGEEDTAKRKRESDETPVRPKKQVRTKRITRASQRTKSSRLKTEEKEEKKTKKKEKGSKKKKKPAETTLSTLRKKSLRTKAARTRYFERLRKDFVSSAKVDATLNLLRHIRDKANPDDDGGGEKTLVFSLWTSFLDLLEIPLRGDNFCYLRFDGATPPAERDDNVRQFQDPNSGVQILLVSLQAGNAGLNLTAASHVIMLEPFWNPFVEDQAVDRAHRIGQTRPVTVYRLLVPDSVEDRILELQERKRALVEAALSEKGAIGAARLSRSELRGLFGLR